MAKQFLTYLDNQKFCVDGQCDIQAAMSVTTEDQNVKGHPNAMPFKGTLLLVDQKSDKPPQGADGHCIFVPRSVAENQLTSLVGMAVNFVTSADKHAPQKKVGVINSATLDGNKVKVQGIVWAKDFPKEAQEIKANSPRLGMSMELADVWVEDKNSSVWKLTDFKFTGGSILLKNSAAYYKTSLAARAAQRKQFYVSALAAASAVVEGKIPIGGNSNMATKVKSKPSANRSDKTKKLLAQLAAAAAAGVSSNLKEQLDAQAETNKLFAKSLTVLANAVKSLKSKKDAQAAVDPSGDPSADMSASAQVEDELTAAMAEIEVEAENASVAAAKKTQDDGSEDPSVDDGSVDDGSVDDGSLEAALEDLGSQFSPTGTDSSGADPSDQDPKPGAVNKGAMSKFKKNSTRHVHAAADNDSHLVEQMNAVAEENAKLKKVFKKQKVMIDAMQAQIDHFTEHVNRKTVSPELSMVLAKGNYSVPDLMANSEKLSVAKADELFAACAAAGLVLGPTERIQLKNQMAQLGILESGEIVRYQ